MAAATQANPTTQPLPIEVDPSVCFSCPVVVAYARELTMPMNTEADQLNQYQNQEADDDSAYESET